MRNGLSTATAVDGALRGAQQMSGIIDSHKRRGLMDAEAQRAEEIHGVRMAGAEQQQNFQQEKMDHVRQDREKAAAEEAKRAFILSGKAKANAVARGDMSKEDLELLDRYPLADVEYLQSEQVGKALSTLKGVMSGEAKLPYNEKGAIDLSQNPDLADALMALDPNLTKGNKDGKKVRPHYLIPSEDGKTLRVGLDVDGDDRVRPLTVNRSSADDDPVMEIQTADLINSIMAAERARELSSQPEFYKYLMESEGLTDPNAVKKHGEPFRHQELGWVQAGPDGELRPIKSGAGGKDSSSGQDPASIKAADAYIQRIRAEGNEPPSFEDAFRIANSAMADPLNFIGQTIRSEMERQSAYGVQPGDPDYRTREQIEQDAIRSVREIRNAFAKENSTDPRVKQVDDALSQESGKGSAPPEALEYLKANPDTAEMFKSTFGYLPEGF